MNFEEILKTIPNDYPDTMMSKEELKILYNACLRIKPKTIVELGTGYGHSTIALALGAKAVDGVVTTVDKEDRDGGRKIGEDLKKFGLRKYVKFVVKDDIEFSKVWTTPIDLLYVDTDHSYEFTVKVLDAWFPLLSKKGEVYFHDVLHPSHCSDINKAILEFIINRIDHSKMQWSALPENTINYQVYMTSCGIGHLTGIGRIFKGKV